MEKDEPRMHPQTDPPLAPLPLLEMQFPHEEVGRRFADTVGEGGGAVRDAGYAAQVAGYVDYLCWD